MIWVVRLIILRLYIYHLQKLLPISVLIYYFTRGRETDFNECHFGTIRHQSMS